MQDLGETVKLDTYKNIKNIDKVKKSRTNSKNIPKVFVPRVFIPLYEPPPAYGTEWLAKFMKMTSAEYFEQYYAEKYPQGKPTHGYLEI